MRKAYILVYNDSVGSRDIVKNWADQSSKVLLWRYDLPHCFYLISEATAAELHADLEASLGRRGRFLITEISENRQGLLTPDTWYLIRNKERESK